MCAVSAGRCNSIAVPQGGGLWTEGEGLPGCTGFARATFFVALVLNTSQDASPRRQAGAR
jgi:hypothetical protein